MGASCGVQENIADPAFSCIGQTRTQQPGWFTSQPLHTSAFEAAAAGDVSRIRLLVKNGLDISVGDRYGRTALHLAASEGHTEMVDILLRSGANPNVQDNQGYEPLQEAMMNGHTITADSLQRAGARLSDAAKASLKNQLLLMVAVGDVSKIKAMAAEGFFSKGLRFLRSSMLQVAVEHGQHEIAAFLTSSNTELDGPFETRSKNTNEYFCSEQNQLLSNKASLALIKACPPSISAAMLAGREVQPISTTSSSIVYCDIVGFTTISSILSAAKVTRMIGDLFSRLDRLAYLHGVQKVDVSGDAYIAATNFTEDQPDDHAARLARFAIDALAAAQAVPIDADDPDGRCCLQMRAGLHCGPVVGIVADHASLKYTLIGETAVTAARMESSGAAGRIQCSAAAARLIAQQAGDIVLLPRSAMSLPAPDTGGGALDVAPTFWVASARWDRRRSLTCPDLDTPAEGPGRHLDPPSLRGSRSEVLGPCGGLEGLAR